MNALVRRNGKKRIGTQVGFKRPCDFSDYHDYHSQHSNNHIWSVRLPTGKRVFMTLDEVGYSEGNKMKKYVGEALEWIGNVSSGFFIVEDTLKIPETLEAVEDNVYLHTRKKPRCDTLEKKCEDSVVSEKQKRNRSDKPLQMVVSLNPKRARNNLSDKPHVCDRSALPLLDN